jgi:hypothetical protein
MQARPLVELGKAEPIDLFLREEDAARALVDCLRNEPEWTSLVARRAG